MFGFKNGKIVIKVEHGMLDGISVKDIEVDEVAIIAKAKKDKLRKKVEEAVRIFLPLPGDDSLRRRYSSGYTFVNAQSMLANKIMESLDD